MAVLLDLIYGTLSPTGTALVSYTLLAGFVLLAGHGLYVTRRRGTEPRTRAKAYAGPNMTWSIPGLDDEPLPNAGIFGKLEGISTALFRSPWKLIALGLATVSIAAIGTTPVDTVIRSAALPLPPIIQKDGSTHAGLIFFVHGWNGGDGTWADFPSMVASDTRFTNYDIQVVNYPTFMVKRNLDIEGLTRWLLGEIRAQKLDQTYQHMAIVAHSMGGLVSRTLIINARLDVTRPLPVEYVIEVATPHDGANPALLMSALGLSRGLMPEMQSGSQFLVTLQGLWDQMRPRPDTYCYSSEGDDVVPKKSAFADCDRKQEQPTPWGHTELVKPPVKSDPRYVLPMGELARHFGL